MRDLNPPIMMICKILVIQVGSNVDVELNPDLIDFNIIPNDESHSVPVTT